MPRPPSRTRQLIDPMAAFQMVHILEGVVERGTATVLRDLDRPMFGKTGTTSGPTNVWFVGGTPDIVAGVYLGYDQPRSLGGYAQGGRIAAPIFKQWAKVALQGHAQGAVRRPGGNPLGAHRPRQRPAGVRHLPDPGGPQVVGDLGGVPAADRAAPLVSAAASAATSEEGDEAGGADSAQAPAGEARAARRGTAAAAAGARAERSRANAANPLQYAGWRN